MGGPRTKVLAVIGMAALLGLTARSVSAHAFGPRYDLPLPLTFYLVGAAGAVVLSFVIMALVFRTLPKQADRPRINLLRFGPIRILLHPAVIAVLQTISVSIFFLILAAGFFGANDPLNNIAPTFVWIIWWVGFAYVTALAGNLWPVVNPWAITFAGFERLVRLFGKRARLDLGLAYPPWLGVWPAIVLLGVFAWFELINEQAQLPQTLATFILVYSVLTWFAMYVFGRDQWLAKGEAFSLVFGILGRFAPIARPGNDCPDDEPTYWYLRPYASDLVVEKPCHLSMTVFVLLMLSTVTFDGFKETPLWTDLLQWAAFEPLFMPLRLLLNGLGLDFLVVLSTVMLLLFPLAFFLVYMIFSGLARYSSGSERPVLEIAGIFVLSLVPIAIAYHLAHYLSYLLVAGQLIIPLASDPFGLGWNLFGTVDYKVDISIIGAKFLWYTAVVAIVAGHVFAVGVAHFAALRVFETARAALRSQYPFLVLMIGYTVVSLWILSQPIVEGPDYNSFRAPSGMLSLARGDFEESCLDMSARDEIRYEFKSDHPVAFNIHFHDGSAIQYPVQLNEVTEFSDSFVANVNQSYCLMWSNQTTMRTTLFYQVDRP